MRPATGAQLAGQAATEQQPPLRLPPRQAERRQERLQHRCPVRRRHRPVVAAAVLLALVLLQLAPLIFLLAHVCREREHHGEALPVVEAEQGGEALFVVELEHRREREPGGPVVAVAIAVAVAVAVVPHVAAHAHAIRS